jgi:ubiquinone/menaquinone biosynthesis C-methylase UbiE
MSFWRWKAPVYSLVRRLPLFRHILAAEQHNLIKLLQQFPPASGAHLDLGSGTGDSLRILPFTKKRFVVDADFSMLRHNPAPHRLAARAETLPFPSKFFVFVSAVGLLEYVNEVEIFFSEVRRVLQPKGYFLFTSSPPSLANHLRVVWGEKLHFYSERQLRKILKANGWQILEQKQSWLQEQWLVTHR